MNNNRLFLMVCGLSFASIYLLYTKESEVSDCINSNVYEWKHNGDTICTDNYLLPTILITVVVMTLNSYLSLLRGHSAVLIKSVTKQKRIAVFSLLGVYAAVLMVSLFYEVMLRLIKG